MKQDKALKKTLANIESKGLSYGFDQKVMKLVLVEAEKKRKRTNVLSLGLVSMVSLLIVVGASYLINTYTSFSSSISFPQIQFSESTRSIIFFSLYIAAIVLILLGFDGYLRRLKQKQHK